MENKEVILRLSGIGRTYPAGEKEVDVLKDIDLTIHRGEMVAIIGASGSGKSTLMNILGCLDHASRGSYYVAGKDTASLDADGLSDFRRNYFGFIFQRYHLLGSLSALSNVEIPAIYSGLPASQRAARAKTLLERLGMGERLHHKPGQLSGGQQQRVSIARALMNNAEIILADEPTGALDKKSGEEVLSILAELHQEGRTIILVTHDQNVAARADRIIEISDGCIISDKRNEAKKGAALTKEEAHIAPKSEGIAPRREGQKFYGNFLDKARIAFDRFKEAALMALISLNAHRMRTFLTMLGVIIGISAVVSMVALGNGTKAQILDNINSLGSNTLTIFPGKSMSDMDADKITSLVDADAQALSKLPFVQGATPNVGFQAKVINGATQVNGIVNGVGEQFFKTQGIEPIQGHFFTPQDIQNRALDVVLEKSGVQTLFPYSQNSPVGKVILVGDVFMRIIGIYESKFPQGNNTLSLYIPYTTAQTRFLGSTRVGSITVRIADNADSMLAENAVTRFLTMRHGSKDFFIRNSEEFRKRVMQSVQVLTVFVSSIAFISLFVGGIGVMNIMLVAVSERINEIGVRMAVGARQSDILQQFLIEAVLVCILGGLIGVSLSLALGWVFALADAPFKLIYSLTSIVGAVLFASFIGISFGFLPARNASRLDPVDALARD